MVSNSCGLLLSVSRFAHLLVFLGGGFLWDVDDGEFPPLSPPDEPLSSLDVDGPAVTLKSQFSFDMRNSSWSRVMKWEHGLQPRDVMFLVIKDGRPVLDSNYLAQACFTATANTSTHLSTCAGWLCLHIWSSSSAFKSYLTLAVRRVLRSTEGLIMSLLLSTLSHGLPLLTHTPSYITMETQSETIPGHPYTLGIQYQISNWFQRHLLRHTFDCYLVKTLSLSCKSSLFLMVPRGHKRIIQAWYKNFSCMKSNLSLLHLRKHFLLVIHILAWAVSIKNGCKMLYFLHTLCKIVIQLILPALGTNCTLLTLNYSKSIWQYPTLSWGKLVALFQSLSSRICVMRGNRIEMPSAVCISDLENSAPVISQTGACCKQRKQQQQVRH